MVRQIAQFGGDISFFVPAEILEDVEEILKNK
jgi:phosphopantetheine adenylyltransferase